MQSKQTVARPQRSQSRPPLSREMAAAGRSGRSNPATAAAAASLQDRCVVHVEIGERPKGSFGQKEILRRALTPPPTRQRLGLRRWNFRPTPSRLSTMSMA